MPEPLQLNIAIWSKDKCGSAAFFFWTETGYRSGRRYLSMLWSVMACDPLHSVAESDASCQLE